MSEKGQGDESDQDTGVGTGVGVDGTPTGGGSGSRADQSGPGSADDPLGGLTPADLPPPPTPEEEPPTEPTFPGGGPTDTRSGWDEPQGPPQETPDETRAREQAERQRSDDARDRAMAERDRRRAAAQGPQIEPTDLPPDLDTDSGSESVLDNLPPEENKPVVS